MLNYGEILTSKVSCPICGNLELPSSGVKIPIQDYLNTSSGQIFHYVPCNCGVFYLENQPISSEIAKIYTKEYDAYHISEGIVTWIKKKRLQSLVTPLMSKGRETKILDYGCGSGEFVYSASELVDATVVGFDLFPPTNSIKSNVVFLDSEQSIESMGPYQLIFAFQVIEHVSDPQLFISFLYSQLDFDGTLVIETPSSSGLLFSSPIRKYWGGWHAPRHFLIFNKESLVDLCTRAGFRVESFQFIPSPFQWIETLRALLGKHSKLNKYLHLRNFFIVASVYVVDSLTIILRFKSSNMKIVLKKI
jgi:SAM-dependent methyltransferase